MQMIVCDRCQGILDEARRRQIVVTANGETLWMGDLCPVCVMRLPRLITDTRRNHEVGITETAYEALRVKLQGDPPTLIG